MEKYVWDGTPPLIDIHSIKKHHVIEEYLFQYIRIVGGTVYNVHHLDLTIIDGFAGGGLYRQHDGTLHDGSPLICLRSTEAAAALVAQEKHFTLNAHYFFIDRNKQSLEFLRSLLKERGYGGRLEKDIFLKCNRFEKEIDTVIEHITSRRGRSHRCIFLLDQYGYSEVPIHVLRHIFRYLPHAEIILTFAVDAMIDYMSTASKYIRAIENLGLTIEIVPNLLQYKDQKGWRSLLQHKIYRELMKQLHMPELFTTNFFVKSSESNRAYWILHFSLHPRARDAMVELHWQLQNHFVHDGRAGFNMLMYDPEKDLDVIKQPSLFFDANAKKLNEEALLSQIPRRLSYEGIQVQELLKNECNGTSATFGDIKDVLGELYNAGEIEIRTAENKEKRKHTKINADDLIKRPAQLSFLSPRRPPQTHWTDNFGYH